MLVYTYKTQGTCSRKIEIRLEEGRVQDVRFEGGCNGNLKGIGALVKGMPVDEVIHRLSGLKCGFKQTSCPDQLARALQECKDRGEDKG